MLIKIVLTKMKLESKLTYVVIYHMVGNVNDKAENQDNSNSHLNPTATFVINPTVGSTTTVHGVDFVTGTTFFLFI